MLSTSLVKLYSSPSDSHVSLFLQLNIWKVMHPDFIDMRNNFSNLFAVLKLRTLVKVKMVEVNRFGVLQLAA